VSELDERVKTTFDWKEHPWLALGCAAVAGFAVARMIKPRQTAGERLIEAFSDNAERLGRGMGLGYERSGPGILGLAMGALAAGAGRAASSYFLERYGDRSNGNPAAEGDKTSAFTDMERF
jgi:hypothetical protein